MPPVQCVHTDRTRDQFFLEAYSKYVLVLPAGAVPYSFNVLISYGFLQAGRDAIASHMHVCRKHLGKLYLIGVATPNVCVLI
jgi:hypothetical protein